MVFYFLLRCVFDRFDTHDETRRKAQLAGASRGCFWFARSLRWFGRQFIVIWFDHTQPSPLLPMASTGHPPMASLQSASSSGVVGCLNT